MAVFGYERRFERASAMSVLPPIATDRCIATSDAQALESPIEILCIVSDFEQS